MDIPDKGARTVGEERFTSWAWTGSYIGTAAKGDADRLSTAAKGEWGCARSGWTGGGGGRLALARSGLLLLLLLGGPRLLGGVEMGVDLFPVKLAGEDPGRRYYLGGRFRGQGGSLFVFLLGT